jgi:hypothetical protein
MGVHRSEKDGKLQVLAFSTRLGKRAPPARPGNIFKTELPEVRCPRKRFFNLPSLISSMI